MCNDKNKNDNGMNIFTFVLDVELYHVNKEGKLEGPFGDMGFAFEEQASTRTLDFNSAYQMARRAAGSEDEWPEGCAYDLTVYSILQEKWKQRYKGDRGDGQLEDIADDLDRGDGQEEYRRVYAIAVCGDGNVSRWKELGVQFDENLTEEKYLGEEAVLKANAPKKRVDKDKVVKKVLAGLLRKLGGMDEGVTVSFPEVEPAEDVRYSGVSWTRGVDGDVYFRFRHEGRDASVGMNAERLRQYLRGWPAKSLSSLARSLRG